MDNTLPIALKVERDAIIDMIEINSPSKEVATAAREAFYQLLDVLRTQIMADAKKAVEGRKIETIMDVIPQREMPRGYRLPYEVEAKVHDLIEKMERDGVLLQSNLTKEYSLRARYYEFINAWGRESWSAGTLQASTRWNSLGTGE